jgi:hypothetical protein
MEEQVQMEGEEVGGKKRKDVHPSEQPFSNPSQIPDSHQAVPNLP